MGFASVFHYGVRIPTNFDLGMPSVRQRVPAAKWSGVHSRASRFYSVYYCRRAYCVPVSCSKGTDHEDDLSPSEGKRVSAQPRDDIGNSDTRQAHASVDNTQESGANEAYMSSVNTVALWVGAAVAFGVGVGFKEGVDKASEFFAGYILEQSLSVDNLFVFVLVFKYFKVPLMYQNRVLSYGIAGAVVFRLILILLGTATLQRFEAVNLLLAGILLYSSLKLFTSEGEESDLSDNFIMKTCQRFIPVTTYYDGNRFITNQDGIWKGSNILGRPHLCFLL